MPGTVGPQQVVARWRQQSWLLEGALTSVQRLTLTSYETQAQPQDPAPDPPAQNGPVQTASGWWVLALSTQTGGWSPRPSTSGPHVQSSDEEALGTSPTAKDVSCELFMCK